MVEELTPEEVKAKLENDEVQVVDIRDQQSFEEGHIPGAINLPMQALPRAVDKVEWDDEIVCVCPIGQSSIQAAKLIKSFEGIDDDAQVTSMKGGYRDWEYDLETGSDSPETETGSAAAETESPF